MMNHPITEILADNYLTFRQIELKLAHCVRVTYVLSKNVLEKSANEEVFKIDPLVNRS